MKHDWRQITDLDERTGHGFHIFDRVRACGNCFTYQKREQLYDGSYGNRGPKVTGYRWVPLAGRCDGGE